MKKLAGVRIPLRGAIAVAIGIVFLLAAFAPLEARVISVNSASIAGDTNFSNNLWGSPSTGRADLFYRIDQGTVNTTSLELEISPDGVDWYDDPVSPTLLSANAADATGVVADIPIHGYQFRLVANTTNTNTITPVLKIVIR